LALSLARGALGRMARFVRYARSLAPVPGLRYRSYPWHMLACASSGTLSIMPADCIAPPQAYNPHNHRSHGGSVQRGLSAAIAAAAGFNVCGAADKRYSLGTSNQHRGNHEN
jgi:hypothetical protein